MSAIDPRAEDSEFRIVVSRKGKNRPKSRAKLQTSFNRTHKQFNERIEVCHQTVTKQLQAAESELLQSLFFRECCEELQPILAGVKRIICLGLGRFSECSIARYQLAFIRCLRDKANLNERIQFYDPVFSSSEVEILQSLAEAVLQENVEGKYSAEHCRTLFYLPHCPKQIVNNVLWKNWQQEHLTNVILLCNSFCSITNNHPRRFLERSAGYILRATGVFQEVPLRNNFRFTDIFNDTSLHYLPIDVKLDDILWQDTNEPSYDTEDLELITKEVVENLVFS
ncbi:SRR1-like protein [Anopheles ziemanni]|uniref:SRR1-like protein n=1 Tax=Anopheles coustani TaxID=139045 RepID=UPI002659DA3C|nr:SRR1-like protein [Anopheles coustani]XP_058172279.1 SRR1-like protein [Anopheles ziemanni]